MSSSLDKLLDCTNPSTEKPNVVGAIRTLATNKDLRIFLTALCKYSKADWSKLIKMGRIIYGVLQSSMLIKQDSELADEITKIPHIAMFFRRLNEEDV